MNRAVESHARTFEGRMIAYAGKIQSSDVKARVRMCQEGIEVLDFQRIAVFYGLFDRNVGRVDGQRRRNRTAYCAIIET